MPSLSAAGTACRGGSAWRNEWQRPERLPEAAGPLPHLQELVRDVELVELDGEVKLEVGVLRHLQCLLLEALQRHRRREGRRGELRGHERRGGPSPHLSLEELGDAVVHVARDVGQDAVCRRKVSPHDGRLVLYHCEQQRV